MTRLYKDGAPAICAVIFLVIVEGINVFVNVLSLRELEIFSNTILLLIAVLGFFVADMPAKKNKEGNLANILGNVMVSVVAFPMNIEIFGHVIRLEQLWKDLWGWHLWWLSCAVMQVLFLSKLKEKWMEQTRAFLAWSKRTIKSLESPVLAIHKGIEEKIEDGDKGVIIMLIMSVVLWGIYFGGRAKDKGIYITLADGDFWWGSMKLWIGCIGICFLINIAAPLLSKMKEAIVNMDSKKVLALVTIIVLVIVMFSVSPILQGMLGGFLETLILMLGIVSTYVKALRSRNRPVESDGENSNDEKMSPAVKKLLVFAFGVIPLSAVILTALFFLEGGEILSSQELSINTLIKLWEMITRAADELLKLFAI